MKMWSKVIICFCLIAYVRCFITNFPIKTKTRYLNQMKTPLIIYDSESNMVISNIIEKTNNKSNNNGNDTSVLINSNPHIPVSPSFQNLCKMNFVSLV
jgi:hypothetical protein